MLYSIEKITTYLNLRSISFIGNIFLFFITRIYFLDKKVIILCDEGAGLVAVANGNALLA